MNMLLYHLQKLQVLRSETIVMESILILFFHVAHGLLCWFVHVNWWFTTFWIFYTLYYLIKLFWLTPIHLRHFRDRLCYISRKSLLPIHHHIAQELVLKFHPIEVPKTLVNFQPFQDGSFSQNMGKQMKKLILSATPPLLYPRSLASFDHLLSLRTNTCLEPIFFVSL